MAINTQDVTNIITDFRNIVAKDAISPETVGYIMQRIADLVATAEEDGTYDTLRPIIDQLQAEVNQTVSSVQTIQQYLEENFVQDANKGQQAIEIAQAATATADIANQKAVQAKAAADAAQATADINKANITALTNSKGKESGLAPLDENGRIAEQYLPAFVDDSLEFNGVVGNVSMNQAPSDKRSTDEGCSVMFSSALNTLILNYNGMYYYEWADSRFFGRQTSYGVVPVAGKIYIDTTMDKSYRWNGSTMKLIGSGLVLGTTEGSAYSGSAGAALEMEQTALSARIGGISSKVGDVNGGVWEHSDSEVQDVGPNTLHVWNDPMESISVSLTDGNASVVNEYMFQFTPQSDEFTFTVTNKTIRWVEIPEWTAGSTYAVSILNGLALVAEWEAEK